MTVLMALGLALLGLLLAVVAVPLHVRAHGSIQGASAAAFAQLDWCGVFGVRLAPGHGITVQLLGRRLARFALRNGRAARRRKERPAPGESEDRRGAGRGAGKLAAVARHRGSFMRIAARLAGALRLRLRVRGTLGTGDPADTAALVGVVGLLERVPGVELAIDWNWTEESVEVEAECSARIWVLQLLAVAARLLWAREHRAALRAVTA